MKRIVRMGDRSLEVGIRREGDRITARVEDRDYLLTVREAQTGVFSMVQADEGGRSTEAVVQEVNGLYRVRVRDRTFEVTVERPGEQGAGVGRGDGAGPSVLKAVMPGRVVRLLAAPGERVEKGQGILVVEAMKMENEIGAPRSGTVVTIEVAAGDRVERGAHLAVIE